MTWKYALGLELEDPGFDASVLSELAGDLTSLAPDARLEHLARLRLVRAGGRQRTDSTHVLGAIRPEPAGAGRREAAGGAGGARGRGARPRPQLDDEDGDYDD